MLKNETEKKRHTVVDTVTVRMRGSFGTVQTMLTIRVVSKTHQNCMQADVQEPLRCRSSGKGLMLNRSWAQMHRSFLFPLTRTGKQVQSQLVYWNRCVFFWMRMLKFVLAQLCPCTRWWRTWAETSAGWDRYAWHACVAPARDLTHLISCDFVFNVRPDLHHCLLVNLLLTCMCVRGCGCEIRVVCASVTCVVWMGVTRIGVGIAVWCSTRACTWLYPRVYELVHASVSFGVCVLVPPSVRTRVLCVVLVAGPSIPSMCSLLRCGKVRAKTRAQVDTRGVFSIYGCTSLRVHVHSCVAAWSSVAVCAHPRTQITLAHAFFSKSGMEET